MKILFTIDNFCHVLASVVISVNMQGDRFQRWFLSKKVRYPIQDAAVGHNTGKEVQSGINKQTSQMKLQYDAALPKMIQEKLYLS